MTIPILGFLILVIVILLLLFFGLPVVFALGSVSVSAIFLLRGPESLNIVGDLAYNTFTSEHYIAIVMFLLMANCLQRSGLADELYHVLKFWTGKIHGGLAISTVIISTIFAAMCGGSGPAIVTMGVIALPSMLKNGYDKKLALGSIASGAVLGIIIPPSIPMIILAEFGGLSIGQMFFAGLIPGLLCSLLYIVYIIITCKINPELAPIIPLNHKISARDKIHSLTVLIGPCLTIFLTLGAIGYNVANPAEAAAIGSVMLILLIEFKGRLRKQLVAIIFKRTLIVSSMLLWLLISAKLLELVYRSFGIIDWFTKTALIIPGGAITVLIIMLLINFILGMLVDDFTIIILTAPLYFPIITALQVNPIWFAILFMLNLQMAYLTPPFGYNLFFLKSIVPDGIKFSDIYKSVIPFILLQMTVLIIALLFPSLVTWLPNNIIL